MAGLLLSTALLVVGHVLPASAATTYTYTLSNNPPGDGTIQVSGSITFQSRTSFTYSVDVRDLCGPTGAGDGYGAANRFGLNTPDLSYITEWKKDQDGCGTNKHFTGTATKTVDIENVYAFLGRTNGSTVTAVAQSNCFDNPYVAGSTC
jgi:hypothetical protein